MKQMTHRALSSAALKSVSKEILRSRLQERGYCPSELDILVSCGLKHKNISERVDGCGLCALTEQALVTMSQVNEVL